MWVYMDARAHVLMSTWRWTLSVFLSYSPPFFGESESLTEPEALQFLLGQLTISSRDPLILPLPHSQGNRQVPAMLSFYMGPNSGPPACVEPASQLPSP